MAVEDFIPEPGAEATIRAGLATWGLEGLFDTVWGKYTKSEYDPADKPSLAYIVKDTPEYKTRFAGNQIREANKLPVLDPASYIQMEDAIKDTLQQSGLPPGFYDSQADLNKFIGGDTSRYELRDRIQGAYNLVRDAPADVTDKLKSMYNLSDGDILAYFIDPDKARPTLIAADYRRQAQASLVAAKAQRTAGINIGVGLAEDVVRKDISQEAQTAAFTRIADMNELTRAQGMEKDLTEEQIAAAELGTDAAAREVLQNRKKGRIASFSGGGEFSLGQSGGTGRSGIGQAGV
jgi:hypothetical protein